MASDQYVTLLNLYVGAQPQCRLKIFYHSMLFWRTGCSYGQNSLSAKLTYQDDPSYDNHKCFNLGSLLLA